MYNVFTEITAIHYREQYNIQYTIGRKMSKVHVTDNR